MLSASDFSSGSPERLALDYFARVWAPPHDVSAMDELMTEDVVLISGGRTITGRDAFKAWVLESQRFVRDVTNETVELMRNPAGDRLTHRWISRGRNNGLFGMPADGRAVALTGITVWTVRDGRLAQCIAERNAWEVFQELGGNGRQGQPTTPAAATVRA